jgi:hypothetical protein
MMPTMDGVVLTCIDPERLGYCPSCDWLFHDTTAASGGRAPTPELVAPFAAAPECDEVVAF